MGFLQRRPLDAHGAGVIRTVGHSALSANELGLLLTDAGVQAVFDVRRRPASRRHPQFGRDELQRWLAEFGLAYEWVEALGGHRTPDPASPNHALGDDAFRGYADHMGSDEFTAALDAVVAEGADRVVAVMCAEWDWRRCHRRLLADAVVQLRSTPVEHLTHDGELLDHRPSPKCRVAGGRLLYDVGTTAPLFAL